MKVALVGYGKMGKTIEGVLSERGHEIVARFDREGIDAQELKKAQVAIEFSRPESAFENITTCLKNKIPVVSGTTGWLEHYPKVCSLCEEMESAFLYASNFSLGVNLFFALNEKLAELMKPYPNYRVSMEEIHHLQKLDAPSGTAISLAEQIISTHPEYSKWSLADENQSITIEAKREAEVPGTHLVHYKSEVDQISIKHQAFNRQGFALGAVLAAEYLVDKRGVYTMKDVLNLS